MVRARLNDRSALSLGRPAARACVWVRWVRACACRPPAPSLFDGFHLFWGCTYIRCIRLECVCVRTHQRISLRQIGYNRPTQETAVNRSSAAVIATAVFNIHVIIIVLYSLQYNVRVIISRYVWIGTNTCTYIPTSLIFTFRKVVICV